MKFWLESFTAIGLILLDQGLKFTISVIDFIFDFKIGSIGIWRNSGAIFSVDLPYYTMVTMSVIALIGLMYGWYYYSYVRGGMVPLLSFGLMLVMAGGVSNIFDRLFADAVVDFILIDALSLYLNLADVYIVLGSMAVLYVLYIGSADKKYNL